MILSCPLSRSLWCPLYNNRAFKFVGQIWGCLVRGSGKRMLIAPVMLQKNTRIWEASVYSISRFRKSLSRAIELLIGYWIIGYRMPFFLIERLLFWCVFHHSEIWIPWLNVWPSAFGVLVSRVVSAQSGSEIYFIMKSLVLHNPRNPRAVRPSRYVFGTPVVWSL